MKAGQCSHELGELEDARECYEAGQYSIVDLSIQVVVILMT